MSKIAKLESDLWKTYEDMVPWSRDILQTFAPPLPTIQTSVNFRNFAELYLRSHHFQTWLFHLFKVLFSVVSTDFPQHVHVKSRKKLRKGLFSNTHNLLLQMYLHLKL